MANRKEYEMLFALNAQMNGGFKGTFSKAQAEFAKLGKEIQALHRLQGDIASYQKQQRAIDATGAKLENLQKQHDMLQKEISETTGSTANLEREKLKLAQRIKDTESALERQKQKLEATGSKLKEAGVNTSELAQKDAELTAKIKELEAEQSKAADSASSFGANSAQAFAAVQQAIAAAGVAVALKEIADAFMECVSVAGDFEEAMSNVEALSGATAGDMDALSDQAKELGATTKFTAKESADAMGYMAMAGWDAAEMMSGMNGVLQLAAASGEDLAMVSDIVTDSLSAFGLTAADTAHFSDVLAAAATNSNTNVAIMGETFKMSASVAGALGYSIEDVAVAVGLMANSGVKGSIAGTALRNTFNGLLEGVTLTGEAFGEYEYSAVKADGSMKDFSSTINELRACFDQMTEAERVSNAMTIAGKRGYNGLLAILNATNEDYTSLTGSINNCTGAAQRMASVKLDNMNGQLVLMNSASEALTNTIGEQFIPEMRGLYSIGTDVFNGLNEFVQANPALVKAGVAFVGVLGVATLGLTAFAAAGKIASALNLAALFTGPAGVAVAAIAGVAALTAAVVGFVTAANEGIPSVKELTEATREMREAVDAAHETYEETAAQTLATAEVAQLYIDRLEEIEAATQGNAEGNQEYHNILALLTRTVPELADQIDLTTDTINSDTAALREHTEAWKKDAEAQAYQEYLNSLYDQYGKVMTKAAENSLKLTQAQIQLETAENNREAALKRMNELSEAAYGSNEMLPQEYYDLADAVDGYNDTIRISKGTIENLNIAIDDNAKAVSDARAEIDGAEEAIARQTGVTKEQTAAAAEAARQSQELNGVIGGTIEQVAALTEEYNAAYNAAYESVHGQYDLWDEAEVVVTTSAVSINAALESQAEYWKDYNTNLQALQDRTADIEGLGNAIASFADGSADSVNAVAGMASATDEELAAIVSSWKTLQEEQKNASGSISELKTDFTDAMDELQKELAADIEEMNLGEEAAKSSEATIQAYIDKANDMLPQVQAAYRQLAQAAMEAIDFQVAVSNPDPLEPSMDLARRYMPSFLEKPHAEDANPPSVRTGPYAESAHVDGVHAEGGILYRPHIGLVAEDGPEAVIPLSTGRRERGMQLWQEAGRMMGVNQNIYQKEAWTAAPAVIETQLIQAAPQPFVRTQGAASARVLWAERGLSALPAESASRASLPPIQFQVNIEGNATPETVDKLREYGDDFAARVMDVFEEAKVNAARRAYR